MDEVHHNHTVDDDYRRDHYLPFQVNVLKCLGMWPANYKRVLPVSLRHLNLVLNVLFYLLMSGNLLQMAVFQIKTLFDAWPRSSMDDVSDFIISSIIYTGGFLMCIYFQVRYRANKNLVDALNKTIFSRSTRGLTYVTVIPCYKWARKLSIYWTLVCVIGTIHYGIYPLLISKRILPINIKYPFDTNVSPAFEIMYFVQFFGQLQIGAIYSVYGTMWISIIILICGQFDVLFCTIKNALWSAILLRGKPVMLEHLKDCQRDNKLLSESTIPIYYNSVEEKDDLDRVYKKQPHDNLSTVSYAGYDSEILLVLRRAVLLHQNILHLSAMLERFFYPFLLGKIGVCSLLACFLAYLSSSGLTSIMKIVTLVEYLLLVFTELLLITYFPTVLLYQSKKLPEAVMNSPWINYSTTVRKTLLIMMSNSIKPIRLTAGKIFNMNLELCASTLKASFSYYTLLKNI